MTAKLDLSETASFPTRDAGDSGGEMGERIRDHDWASTPLGPQEEWPQSLTTTVRIMLSSRFAMWMLWGPDLTFLCNDAYKPTLGIKERWALGARSDKVWEEIWPDIGPRISQVLATGEATWDEGLLLFLERRGFPEETYHTFSYSPLTDDSGAIVGMLCVVTEETDRVVGERRLRVLGDLGGRLGTAHNRADVIEAVRGCLRGNPHDIPFLLAYLFEGASTVARLVVSSGLGRGHPAAPDTIGEAGGPWPVAALRPGQEPVAIADLGRSFTDLPLEPWGRAPDQALLIPVASQSSDELAGFMVAGLNPFRPLDAAYRGFVELFVGQVAAGLAGADAYEAERQRAERLAELDRAKTAFFANVSHEFRTPLTLMLSPLEEMLAKPGADLGQDDRELAGTAHRNGLRLLRLVNSLLDFSRVEAGRATVAPEPTDLAQFTADLAGNFRSLCEQAGLSIAVRCPPLSGPVLIDRDMWEKVVLNLLSNAFKFTFEGGIEVGIREEDGRAVLAVTDTGTGIPADEVPRLFERFHRVEGARGRTFEGSGIGLALVQELVGLLGGSIRVESEPGRGSSFVVSIPMARAGPSDGTVPAARGDRASTAIRAEAFVEEARRWLDTPEQPPALADETVEADSAPRPDGGSAGRILLADDNADMRGHVRRLLEARGYEVESAADGLAALAAARARLPDLLVTDVMMPRLDGFGLLRAFRVDPALAATPVLMLSARAGDEAKVEGLDAGADDYLTKPFSARELLARVGANLQLARARRAVAEALRSANRDLEAELGRRTAEHDRMWRNSRDLLAIVDRDGVFQAANPAWATLLGYGPDAVVGQSYSSFLWPEDAETTRSALDAAFAAGDLTDFENRYRHRDGGPRWFSWRTTREGDLVYAYGRDVTAEKEGVDALLRTEEQLRQAHKMEAVGQLTGGIAHDFNNLLTGISGSLELLQARIGQGRYGDVDRYVNAARGSARRAAALTHRLLAFSRRQTLDPKPVDMNRLVSGMEELIRRTVGPGIAVEVVSAVGLWASLVDPNQLENALLNLCINSRDAMPDGGRITVETANRWMDARGARDHDLPAGQYVSLSVTDTGTGMTADVVAKAFDPFFTTKPIGQGTGLGLSMIYGFARQSGGHVRIYSEVGRGTTVSVYLPRHLGAGEEADPASDPVPIAAASSARTVLVIDDEPTIRMLVTDVLADLGYGALEAADGPAGLKILESGARIDLLVTDVGLPGGMNGRQVADAARASRPDLRVLFITGYAENAAIGNGTLAPGMEVVTKPFALDGLAERIRGLVEDGDPQA